MDQSQMTSQQDFNFNYERKSISPAIWQNKKKI